MTPVAIHTTTTQQIECPHCKSRSFDVTHLLGKETTFGPWYCDDCGHGVFGKVEGGAVSIQPTGKRCLPTLVLLEYKGVRLVVKGMRFEGEASNDEYFYNEHTCPTNYLGVIAVEHEGDDDPHGVFAYVRTEVVEPELFSDDTLLAERVRKFLATP